MKFRQKDGTLLYMKIRDNLKRQIMSDELKPGDRLQNEVELARDLGVSRNTVRKAILELQDEGLLVRARGRGTFVSESHEESQDKQGSGGYILFIQPRHKYLFYNTFYQNALTVLSKRVAEKKYSLMYLTADNDKDLQRMNHGTKVSAIILAGLKDREFLEYIRPLKVPVFSIHEWFPDDDVICVRIDNVLGGFLATQHLIENECRQIAFLAGREDNYPFVERLQGYRMALDAYELEYDDDLVVFAGKDHLQAYDATCLVLKQNKGVDGIFACMDVVALGALEALKDASIRVPDEMSLVGYDDRDFAQLLNPPLTTIRQSGQEVGEKTADILLSLLVGQSLHARDFLVKPELIVRKSTLVR